MSTAKGATAPRSAASAAAWKRCSGPRAPRRRRCSKPRRPTRCATCRSAALSPGKYQPRKTMDEAKLAELAESIKAQGVIQPIVVRDLRRRHASRSSPANAAGALRNSRA